MNILQLLAADKEILLYRKELNQITKKVTATILLQQMIYWYTKSGGAFYKFIKPCPHKLYQHGDSWCEELGFSEKEFNTAMTILKKLGVASSKTDMTRVTYYDLDLTILRKLLNGVYVNAETEDRQPPKEHLDIDQAFAETTGQILGKDNTPQPPKRKAKGKLRENKNALTLAEIADQHHMTIAMIEDFVAFRLNSGGIKNSIAFKKHVLLGLSDPYSDESVRLEEWFKVYEVQNDIIDHLVIEFLSMHWFDRQKCRELAKDDLVLQMKNIVPSDILIEIAFQTAEAKRREQIGGVA